MVTTSALPSEDHSRGRQWQADAMLRVCLPLHTEGMQAVTGGRFAWAVGEGKVSNWYNWPLEWTHEVKMEPAALDQVGLRVFEPLNGPWCV